MSAAVLARGLSEQWKGVTVTAVSVGAMLLLGLWVYQDLDLSIYDALPEAARALMGIPAGADPSLMAYNEMLAAVGALVFTGVSVSLGSRAVAADEAAGRASLVLATPTSRAAFALGKAGATVVAILAGGALLWGIAEAAPRLLGVSLGGSHVSALMAHLVANGLFHAGLAFAIATGLGSRSLGGGVAATVMVGGWLASSLLPMWREGAADWIPWTWFNGSKPLVNGVDGGHLALMLGGAALLIAVGVVGFWVRELRTAAARPGLVQRMRALPGVGRLLQPTGRGASLLSIRLAGHQVLVAYVSLLLAGVMGLAMPAMYMGLRDSLGGFAASFPQSMADLFGGGDLSTAAGFLHLETFGMVAPLCVILVVTAAANAGIAGEEASGRMSVLLAQPLGRGRVYAATAATVVVYSALVSGLLFLGSWAGLALADVELPLADLAWACLLLMLLGWAFGSFALLLSAGTGRTSVTVWGTTAVAVVSYFGYTLLSAAGHRDLGWWSPFSAYLEGPPLAEGAAWWQPVWLAVATLVCGGLGLVLWLRRDVRAGRA